jgi:hypothetical protein
MFSVHQRVTPLQLRNTVPVDDHVVYTPRNLKVNAFGISGILLNNNKKTIPVTGCEGP